MQASSVIQLDKDSYGNPYIYAVKDGGYTRDWERLVGSEALAFGMARINIVDYGVGVNQYTITLIVTTWSPNSVPYKLGCTLTWEQQKQNLENTYKKTRTGLYFRDVFGQPPGGDYNNKVFFKSFRETFLDGSSYTNPIILYDIVLLDLPPGYNV